MTFPTNYHPSHGHHIISQHIQLIWHIYTMYCLPYNHHHHLPTPYNPIPHIPLVAQFPSTFPMYHLLLPFTPLTIPILHPRSSHLIHRRFQKLQKHNKHLTNGWSIVHLYLGFLFILLRQIHMNKFTLLIPSSLISLWYTYYSNRSHSLSLYLHAKYSVCFPTIQ